MANVSKWSKVAVAMQSALAAVKTITAISKATQGMVTYAGVDAVNDGDYVVLTVNGMSQVDGRVFRVASSNASPQTFLLESEDTTDYDTFSSGTFQVITFGYTMSTALGLTASGGDFDFLDITTIHDSIRKQVPGLSSPAVYTFDHIWDASDVTLLAMNTASDNQALRAFRFTFANGQKVVFTGYVGSTLLPTGNAQEVVKTPSVVTMFGRPKILSS
jgi:hypothetical protein